MQSPEHSPRRLWRAPLAAALVAAGLLTAGCSGQPGPAPVDFEPPATQVKYDVVLEGSPSERIGALIEESLATYRLQKDGAQSLAFLRRRAESDIDLLQRILRSEGYYASTAEVSVAGTGPGTATVTITAEPGPAYKLTSHRLEVSHAGTVAPPPLDAAALGSPVGKRADAARIAAAEAAAVAELRRTGFPYARYVRRSGLADPVAATLEVVSQIDAGRAFNFGEVAFNGAENVDAEYLMSYLPWEPGATFNNELLREYQRRLVGTDLFTAASVTVPEQMPAEGADPAPLPVTGNFTERLPRSITAGLRYDTDLGPSARVGIEHRNLFGSNERGLAGVEVGRFKQQIGFGFRKPQFLRPGQEFVSDLTFTREELDAYDALTGSLFAGLERELSETLTVGAGGLIEVSQIREQGETATAYLLGMPTFAAYDGSDDLLNPTRGYRLRLDATPYTGVFDGSDTEFLVLDSNGSGYWRLDRHAKYVLAARGRIGTILSPDLASVPPTKRLYSGGGGSVRGYAQDYVGPLDGNNPRGGRSALESGIELRARLFGDVGGVVFLDAGSVSTQMYPDFEDGVQTAVGFGARYFSPAGPIRVDVAFPLNPRRQDNSFQVYFSIGQAF